MPNTGSKLTDKCILENALRILGMMTSQIQANDILERKYKTMYSDILAAKERDERIHLLETQVDQLRKELDGKVDMGKVEDIGKLSFGKKLGVLFRR